MKFPSYKRTTNEPSAPGDRVKRPNAEASTDELDYVFHERFCSTNAIDT
jgi:hypothetical protein